MGNVSLVTLLVQAGAGLGELDLDSKTPEDLANTLLQKRSWKEILRGQAEQDTKEARNYRQIASILRRARKGSRGQGLEGCFRGFRV
mmetsp:Transcript_25302/g.39688  ORF Transcript_25302/g.39688 Transcript_25302/m.39688 type:complete len:87 (-) Transcript_25302:30-290(-)|eukprot:CAMPEP_0184305016 /NCGR_PEP_ID=MMETSP1049-20130417/14392_1 /TAXON_ID=77928 /ORGANISM="Proteomonas sulcata, Strain CCMP704" /LENGTH=86 /DNA_ID=CAMNT_0026616985 /DNA_START=126 /DNA_END=386 /DNA_ORIENTATION=-